MNKKLQDLLNSKKCWTGGQGCRICRLKSIKKINEDYQLFASRKKAGHTMPWSAFWEYLSAEYKPGWGVSSWSHHGRKCLGLEAYRK